MTYKHTAGDKTKRETVKLTPSQSHVLATLRTKLAEEKWRPTSILPSEKQLLMTNNCAKVRSTRRWWYKRLVSQTNMHDRHAGVPYSTHPVYVDVEGTTRHDEQEATEHVVNGDAVACRMTTHNMRADTKCHIELISSDMAKLMSNCDVLCLQEVPEGLVQCIEAVAAESAFECWMATRKGHAFSLEGFDVAICFRASAFRLLSACVVPLCHSSARRLLKLRLQFLNSGAVLVVGTAHLAASISGKQERHDALLLCGESLEAEDADCVFLIGDLNLQEGEAGLGNRWKDAFLESGSPAQHANTWRPVNGGQPWEEEPGKRRYDRVCYMPARCSQNEGGLALQPALKETCIMEKGSLHTGETAFSDHRWLSATFQVCVQDILNPKHAGGSTQILYRPGIGNNVGRRPLSNESCAKELFAGDREGISNSCYCGKDFEKARMMPGTAAILEDLVKKELFRLYTRRNCHSMNSHDPLVAIGLGANTDEQVILTLHAMIKYLTKYLSKLGPASTVEGRVGSFIDEIVSKMKDNETMTVASMLSKLFIHAAVPDVISSLESWHVIWMLPRTLSTRTFSPHSAKDARSLVSAEETKSKTPEDNVTRKSKKEQYLDRDILPPRGMTADRMRALSWSQYAARIDVRGASQFLRLRSRIVKEKPFLNLDSRRSDAATMARYCLRLHRAWSSAAADPIELGDDEALAELAKFLKSAACPQWLSDRHAKHNRLKRRNTERTGKTQDGKGASTLPESKPSVASAPEIPADPEEENLFTHAPDISSTMRKHGLLWKDLPKSTQYSVCECLASRRPLPKTLMLRRYLDILQPNSKAPASVQARVRLCALLLLSIDLESYEKKGKGLAKPSLSKAQLKSLTQAFVQFHARMELKLLSQMKKERPFAIMWNHFKRETLKEFGFTVPNTSTESNRQHRIASRLTLLNRFDSVLAEVRVDNQNNTSDLGKIILLLM